MKKHLKRYTVFLAIHFCFQATAQKDTTHSVLRFAIYTDLVLDILNEKNIGTEVKFSPHFAVGASYGLIKPLVWGASSYLIANHDTDPGRVYFGHSFRTNIKYYPNRNGDYYIQINALYKNLHYDTARFSDMYGKSAYSYSRADENANLYGADLIFGNNLIVNKYIIIDFFMGIGYRAKHRTYTTFERTWYNSSSGGPLPLLGYYDLNQHFFAGIFGFKIGGVFYKN